MLDILRKPKNAVRKIARNNMGSVSCSQAIEVLYKVGILKHP